jgi:hypothetical protein
MCTFYLDKLAWVAINSSRHQSKMLDFCHSRKSPVYGTIGDYTLPDKIANRY